jgi:hypothetical protein
MKKWLKWLLVTIGVLLVALIIYFIVKQSLREEAVLTFPDTVVVQNATEFKEVDKVLKAISYYVFEYDTINIAVAKMPEHMENINGLDIRAYVYKNIFSDKAYLIFISSTLKLADYKKVLSHEMAHVKQMEDGDLIQPTDLTAPYVIYKGDTIDFHEVPYDRRPHEIDANKVQGKIYKQLEEVLYK